MYLVKLSKPINSSDVAVLKRVAVPDKEALASMRTEVETMVCGAVPAYGDDLLIAGTYRNGFEVIGTLSPTSTRTHHIFRAAVMKYFS